MQKRMDARSIGFDWNRARAFLVTAEHGSLSAAARALGMTQPTLGRQVDALERELGVALFERAGRGLVLTPGGRDLLVHVQKMGEAATQFGLAAGGQSRTLEGIVTISASDTYSALLLPDIIVKIRTMLPRIGVEIVATNQLSDLKRREADIALRNVRPEDPTLIARKVGDRFGRLYATPDYLASIGNPRMPNQFSNAAFISFEDRAAMVKLLVSMGFPVSDQNIAVASDSHVAQWACVCAGLGIGVMDDKIGDQDSRVVRAAPDLDPVPFPIWLVAHRELSTSSRVRAVFDILAEALMPSGKN